MAVDSNIGSLPAAASIEDDSFLVAEQQGEAKHITGKQLKDYAKEGAQQFTSEAQAAAQNAQQAKEAAELARDQAQAIAGVDFLERPVYDPQNRKQDIFAYVDGKTNAIINVTALPTKNINENALYRLLVDDTGMYTEYNTLYSYKNGWIRESPVRNPTDGVHAEIFNDPRNIASFQFAHAEGSGTAATATASHAEGVGSEARGSAAHAEGWGTEAKGTASHAEGGGTIAASEYQHVQGKNNIPDANKKYAHIVGNGASDRARSNAHTIDWDGVGWFAGGLKVGGTGQDDPEAKDVIAVPSVSAADNGKFLQVVEGAWAAVALTDVSEVGV